MLDFRNPTSAENSPLTPVRDYSQRSQDGLSTGKQPGAKPEDESFNHGLERRGMQMVSRTPLALSCSLNVLPRDLSGSPL